jgi:peptidoglycan pentaglycine glycine transferase (the first glycine)
MSTTSTHNSVPRPSASGHEIAPGATPGSHESVPGASLCSSAVGRATATTDAGAWQDFVASHPAGHLLQTWTWGELKSRFGWQVARLGLTEDGRLVGGAQVLLRPLPGGWSIAYIPKGPLVDWANALQVDHLLDGLHQLCHSRRCIFLKVEPPVEDGAWAGETLLRHGFRPLAPTVQPPRTILVDLLPEEQAILAAMKQKSRYNIRLAARRGVTVREGNANDLPTFYRLMQITGQRDGFGIHLPDYYETAYEIFAPQHAALLVAEVGNDPVAGLMAFTHGATAYYLFGASSDVHRELMPTYLLQWEAMRWARGRGCSQYDLWGIPDADEQTLEAQFAGQSAEASGLWGVYRFKRGFGGRISRSIGAFDYVYSRSLYRAYRLWLSLRRDVGIG